MIKVLGFFVGFVIVAFSDNLLAEETAAKRELSLCLGYNPDTASFGAVGISPETRPENCPKDHAWMAVEGVYGNRTSGAEIPVLGSCCPLPAGILKDEHIFVYEECPDNYIATGSKQSLYIDKVTKRKRSNGTYFMRCSAIDGQRYKLGSMTSGVSWGFSEEWLQDLWLNLVGQSPDKVVRTQIPIALRYGVGRMGRISWAENGCIGFPWGSFLVKKAGKSCSEHFFRQLQYTGLAGDPPMGTPVELFPKCTLISDPLDPNASCIK